MTQSKGILPPRGASLAERLEFTGWTVTEAGCWEWLGCILRQGYGQISYGGKGLRAHCAAYTAWVGPIGGLHVLHKCDNRKCINPDHLFLGTNADNIADKVAKGRAQRLAGERNGWSKLTTQQAGEIYTAVTQENKLLREVAADYAVSINCVWDIAHGNTWKEATGAA